MRTFTTTCLAFLLAGTLSAADTKWGIEKVQLGGYVGQRIDGCREKRIMGQNVDELVETFKNPRDVRGAWASEFWGKWVQGAMSYYRYQPDSALYAKIEDSVKKMMATQQPNGYIGDYNDQTQLTNWDVWGRKYTLLGLVKWYRISQDPAVLESACRLLDYTMTQIGPGKKHIYETGYYRGMPPSSILEPVMFLYGETKNEAYLNFAKFIVEDDESKDGPQLIAKCNEPVAKRFVLQKGQSWWSFDNGQKGYEMMSCYIGLLELYKVTGEERYLQAAISAYRHVLDEEVNITGGACCLECFFEGKKAQTHPALHTMETCVTFTWMQFAERLLQICGESQYVDQIERTMYNALMASMKQDNSEIVKYVPLEGFRREGEDQCGVHINCCNANAPRAFAMIPRVAYRMPNETRVDVNLYISSEATFRFGKRHLTIAQETEYPKGDEVTVTLSPDKPMAAQLAFRIPAWSQNTVVEMNGEKLDNVPCGDYFLLSRVWKAGDKIRIHFDMQAHVVEQKGMVAIERGPIVLTRDTRFNDGFVDEAVVVPGQNGIVEATPAEAPENVWMAFTVPVVRGYYGDPSKDTRQIHFCDFASAGNTWDENIRYRVWIPALFDPQRAIGEESSGYW